MPLFTNVKHNIWGLTAIITDILLAGAFPEVYQLKSHVYSGKMTDKYI